MKFIFTLAIFIILIIQCCHPFSYKLNVSILQNGRNRKENDLHPTLDRRGSFTILKSSNRPLFESGIINKQEQFHKFLQEIIEERNPATNPSHLSPDIHVIYSEKASSFFHKKPNHSEIILWKEVLEKLCQKIDYESLNDKYDVISPDRKPRIQLTSIEDLTSSNAHIPSIISSKDTLSQYVSPVLVLIGLNEENLHLTTTPDVYLFLHHLTSAATAVTSYQCDASITILEKYGNLKSLKTDVNPSLSPLSIIQQYWELPATDTTSTAAILSSYSLTPLQNKSNPSLLKKITQTVLSWLPGFLFRRQDIKYKKKVRKVYDIIQDMWNRKSMDDLLFGFYILLDTFSNYYIKSIQSVTNTESTSLKQLICMIKNCRNEMIQCFMNEKCRKALNCLNQCKGNDQVCSYRCITQHECPEFEKFAFCILQKHNCIGNRAIIPKYPDPPPLPIFRGKPLDFETADDILIGHLNLRSNETNALVNLDNVMPWSWKVVCGQNPAYDYFACQHQLFYRDVNNTKVLWYDPVFRVTTFDGNEVWRRRHYRVKRGKVPGQYYFSVLDNGVASNEFWRLLDCADDMSWAVLYYAGAASTAGTSYTGSLLVTPTGRWPNMTVETTARIEEAFRRAEISMWELYEVHNDNCQKVENPPPLQIDYPFHSPYH